MSFNRAKPTGIGSLVSKTLVRGSKMTFITSEGINDGSELEKMRDSFPYFLSNFVKPNSDNITLIHDGRLIDLVSDPKKMIILKPRKFGLKTISDAYHDIGIRALYYSFTPKKENNMSQDLIQAIRVISGTEQKDELSRFENMPANIKEAMNRKMAARQQEASEKVADQLITLMDSAAGAKIRALQLSRSLRTQMNAAIANVKRFHAAEQLANAGNFAPLVLVVHGTSGFTVDEIKKIEQDLEDQIKKDSAEPKTASAARKRSA